MMRSSTDVLVVGAGPVGLLLACELQRQGVDYLLVERTPQRSYFCKAMGVTPRTLELFEGLGIADAAIDCGVWLTGWTSFENGVEIGTQDLQNDGLPYGFLAVPQYDTERILESCLNRQGGVVSREWTLSDFIDGENGLKTLLHDREGTSHWVESRWLVGCDGARSSVRKSLKLEFAGDKYPMSFVLGDVEIKWNQPRGRAYRFTQKVDGQMRNGMVAVPIRGSAFRYRLSMGKSDTDGALDGLGAESSMPPTMDELAAIAAPMLPPGTQVTNLRWSSSYRISHRIVPRYSVNHVFLAGDAAHIHPPIGGLGMNTGLQDAHNLSWKLALVAKGLGPALLDSYSAERRPVGLNVVEETSRAMDKAMADGWRRQSAEERESQLFIHYRLSTLVQDDVPTDQDHSGAPRAGDRGPDAVGLGRPWVAHTVRLRDYIERGHHVLIGFLGGHAAEPEQSAFSGLLNIVAQRLDPSVAGIAILAPDAPIVHGELFPSLIDREGSFQQSYAARVGMVWLIRPDGHIAWRSNRADPDQLTRFIDRFVSGQAVGEAVV